MSEIPSELKYTDQHEWVSAPKDGVVRVGITGYAQEQLGDVVFVQLPSVGAEFAQEDSFGEVESTKSVSEMYAPVTGTITAVNEDLGQEPELVNSDPYGDGWMVEVRLGDAAQLDDLLDADEYERLTTET